LLQGLYGAGALVLSIDRKTDEADVGTSDFSQIQRPLGLPFMRVHVLSFPTSAC